MANIGNKNLGVSVKVDIGQVRAEFEQLKALISSTVGQMSTKQIEDAKRVASEQVNSAKQASREIIAIQKAQVTQALQTNKSMTAGGGFSWLTGGMDAGARSQMAGFYKEQQKNIKETVSTANSAASGIRSAFGGIGAIMAGAFAVRYLVRFGEQALETMHNLELMSQKLGVNITTLQVFSHMAKLAGTDIDGVSRGLGIMSKHLVTAEMGGQDAYKALKSLDISAKDANGTLKSSDQILIEIANKFKIMADGTGKTALAMMLFGRSGKDMIPILNQGGEAIQQMHDRMERLGILISEDTIQAASEFKDHLEELGLIIKGLAMRVVGELSPSLDNLVTAFLNGDTAGTRFKDTAVAIANAIKGVAVTAIGVAAAFDIAGTAIGGYASFLDRLTTNPLEAFKNSPVLEGLDKKLQYYGTLMDSFWKNAKASAEAAKKTFAPDFDSENMSKGLKTLKEWKKLKESLKLDMDKLDFTDFEKKLEEIINKGKEMGREFGKFPGAKSFIAQWSARMTMAVSEAERESLTKEANDRLLKLRQDYVKEEEKYQKHITDATGTELQKRITEEEKTAQDMVLVQNKYLIEGLMDLETFLKKEEEIRGASGERIQKFTDEHNLKLRESEIEHQLNLIDIAEQNRFISKPEAIAQKIRQNEQLLQNYKAGLDKIKDNVAWQNQQALIDKTNKSLLDLNKQMRDYTGSALEGFKEGLQRYADANSGMFKNMADAGEQSARAMENGFAGFLDHTSDNFLNLRSLVINIANDISKALIRAAIVQPLVSGIMGLFTGTNEMSLLGDITSLFSFARGGVLTRPVVFPMANGLGLAGEAGYEGVLPLTRTSSGDLGVRSTGGNNQSNLNVKIELINKSNQKLAAQAGTPRFNAQEVIIPVVIDAIDRNVMGLRTMLAR